MEREILFRGKRLDGGEWVDGNYYESDMSGCFILQNIQKKTVNARTGVFSMRDVPIPYEVDPATVGQYTGMTDRNGVKIFEGDIVEAGSKMLVMWDEVFASWCIKRKGWAYKHFFGEGVSPEDCEVVGNCWDNPEILEVKK